MLVVKTIYKQKYTNLFSVMSRGTLRQIGNSSPRRPGASSRSPQPPAGPGLRQQTLLASRLPLEAHGQELARQRRQAAVRDLADARRAIAHSLGDFVRPIPQTVSELQQRATARRDAREHAVQVVSQLVPLLARRLGSRDELQDGGVHGLAQAAATLSPVHDAFLLYCPDQPVLGAADLVPLVEQGQLCVLHDVLGVLRRHLEAAEHPFQPGPGTL